MARYPCQNNMSSQRWEDGYQSSDTEPSKPWRKDVAKDESFLSPTCVTSHTWDIATLNKRFTVHSFNSMNQETVEDSDQYGYGDGAPDSDNCGYGRASPDIATNTKNYYQSPPSTTRRTPSGFVSSDTANQYGYEEAAPDCDKYGYGYGDAAPDNKYGYEDAAPDSSSRSIKKQYPRDERRSSVGGVIAQRRTSPKARRGTGRRASISYSGELQQPSRPISPSHTRAARRSSMKQEGAPRRSSIGFKDEVEVHLPGQDSPVKRRTSIQFKDVARVRRVVPVKQLTDNYKELWYQKSDMRRFRRASKDLIDKIEHGHVPQGRKYCVRGLEGRLKQNQINEQMRRYDAWDSVMDEQELQRQINTYDEYNIGMSSMLATMASQEEAQERAKQDEMAVQKYLKNTRKFCRRLSM